MKRRQTHLGTTPSGRKVYLDKLPHQYPSFSAEDHSYAAVLHEANRTPGGVADLHRAAADERFRSLRRASGRRSHATRASSPRDWTARQMTSGRRVVEKARGSKIARIFQGEGHWTVTINRREPREPFETTGEITRQSAKTLAAAKSLGTRLLKG